VEEIREVLHFENGVEHKILITYIIAKVSCCVPSAVPLLMPPAAPNVESRFSSTSSAPGFQFRPGAAMLKRSGKYFRRPPYRSDTSGSESSLCCYRN